MRQLCRLPKSAVGCRQSSTAWSLCLRNRVTTRQSPPSSVDTMQSSRLLRTHPFGPINDPDSARYDHWLAVMS